LIPKICISYDDTCPFARQKVSLSALSLLFLSLIDAKLLEKMCAKMASFLFLFLWQNFRASIIRSSRRTAPSLSSVILIVVRRRLEHHFHSPQAGRRPLAQVGLRRQRRKTPPSLPRLPVRRPHHLFPLMNLLLSGRFTNASFALWTCGCWTIDEI